MQEMNLFNVSKENLFHRLSQEKKRCDSLAPFTEEEQKKLEEISRIRETHSTNFIENNTLTLSDVALVLKDGIAPKGKKVNEVIETRNSSTAILNADLWLAKNRSINEDMIKDFHYMFTVSLIEDRKSLGEYRVERNWIGNASIHTSPVNAINKHMKELLAWYGENKNILHPVELAIRFKYRLVCIHPFIDGNGRVSRMCMNYILKQNGYLPIVIDVNNKEEYYKALEASHKDSSNFACEPLVKFLIKELIACYEYWWSILNEEE